MSKIVVIGAGAMGTAFTFPCLDNNHDINIIGTHLENDSIHSPGQSLRSLTACESLVSINGGLHPSTGIHRRGHASLSRQA